MRVFDGDRLTESRIVVITDGRISSDATADNIVDGGGGTLLPGLIDSHVHLNAVENLEQAAQWGVTTMLDMGTPSPELVRSLRALPGLTDIRSSQSPASAPGSLQITKMGFAAATAVAGQEEAEGFVVKRVGEGAEDLKIIIENPSVMGSAALDGRTIAALVRAAHARSLRVFAHVTSVSAFRLGIDAQVDVLTHAPLDAALIDRMVASGTVSVPTLVMMRGVAALGKMQTHPGGSDYHNAEISVTAFRDAHIPVPGGYGCQLCDCLAVPCRAQRSSS